MAFEIRRGEAPEAAIRRIAGERIGMALAAVGPARAEDATRERVDAAVHDARKRCKELRALLRLVRPCFESEAGGYDLENAAFRDAASLLGDLRDARTLLDALDGLLEDGDRDQGERFASIRESLAERREREAGDAWARLAEFATRMVDAKDRAVRWRLEASGFAALRGGLEKTYGRCRSAMDAARADPTTENLHDWRKGVKYNRYHLRLLRGMWKPVIEPMRREAKRLSDLLGDEHDLAGLEAAVRERAGGDGPAGGDVAELLALIDRRRAGLRRRAFTLGGRLYALSPERYGHHARALWRAWR